MNQSQDSQFIADILIVDDRPKNLKLLSKILIDYDYRVRCAISGKTALDTLETEIPDLILLDVTMPEMDGYQVCRKLKSNPKTARIPIIFISALDAAFDKVKAFGLGAADYITKPFEIAEVIVRIKFQLQLRKTQHELERANQKLAVFNKKLEQKVIEKTTQLQLEESQRRQTQDKLTHMALHDPLTNLANKIYLIERLQTCIDIVQHAPLEQFALIFIDCNRFKRINDSLGKVAGDHVLAKIAQRLQEIVPEENLIARSGGNEFIILLETIEDKQSAIAIAETIHQEFAAPICYENKEIKIDFSIGIIIGNDCYTSPDQLLRHADIALHQAKKNPILRYQIFEGEITQRAIANLQLETDLHRAIQRQEFVLFYQPIVCLKREKIVGVEALIRWQHPQKGLVPPNDFIPIAEDSNLIIPIGEWVIQEACDRLSRWQRQTQYPKLHELAIEVNLSVKQLAQPDLVEQLENIIREAKVDPQALKLEITETILMEDVETSRLVLNKLKASGFHLMLDDFGTGYSSLRYLQQLTISTIKIDRSFVNNLEQNTHNQKIVAAMVNLAHTLGLNVIAEGIETKEQLEMLQQLGCDYGQGYLFGKPTSVADFEKMIVQESVLATS